VQPFRYNTDVWQTDRHAYRQTYRHRLI